MITLQHNRAVHIEKGCGYRLGSLYLDLHDTAIPSMIFNSGKPGYQYISFLSCLYSVFLHSVIGRQFFFLKCSFLFQFIA